LKYAGESINIDDEILENVDTDKFGKKEAKHYIRYRTKNMYNTFFKDESVTVQAQLLLCLIKSRKLKEATSLLGIQKSTKDTKVKQNVFDNITSVLKAFGKSRKKDVSVARRVIQTTVVSSSNIKDRLTQHMEKTMGTSRKTLYKHRKFRLQIDANDELERGVNQYQVQFKTFFNLYLNHSTISNEK
jgi:ABC-type ATPase with predicted acetyltransferase domain